MAKFSLEEGEEEMRGKKRIKVRGGGEEIDANSSKKGKKLKIKRVGKEEEQEILEDEEEEYDDGGEEEECEGEEEEEYEEVNASPLKENGDGISARIDPDVLDCSICFEPLRPPLYQCEYGHIACSSCWSKLHNRCHLCSCEVKSSRNIALEKIVESIKVSCSYAKWGCLKTISYAERHAHEEACIYSSSTCPCPNCTYKGFTGWWLNHFIREHNMSYKRFSYSQYFEVNLRATEPFLALIGHDDHLFLLLNKCVVPMGNALSIVCLRPGDLGWKFSYEVKSTSHDGSTVRLKASVTNTREWKGIHPTDAFLLVPNDFHSSGHMTLNIIIRNIRC
ncbi:putative E3 ubiquitin-protein ligase SINA-like 9 [Typha latifolia]|uniref:putative E3 ubiquitin-protein ligase SINA-like 9 n=1 Tax=Typha latifolia TaxID=4733 RepID=UPI003C2FB457